MPRVFVSAIIPAPVDGTWEKVRDFSGLPRWLPLVSECRILDGMSPDQVGCTREFYLQNGDRITETLVALSDYEMTQSYTMRDTPMPLWNYLATIRLTPVTETDETFAEWSAEFECAADDEEGLLVQIGEGVFETGLKALARQAAG